MTIFSLPFWNIYTLYSLYSCFLVVIGSIQDIESWVELCGGKWTSLFKSVQYFLINVIMTRCFEGNDHFYIPFYLLFPVFHSVKTFKTISKHWICHSYFYHLYDGLQDFSFIFFFFLFTWFNNTVGFFLLGHFGNSSLLIITRMFRNQPVHYYISSIHMGYLHLNS